MSKILVIDDDAEFVESISDLLVSLLDDTSVDTALTGESGIKCALSNPPDAILLDLGMPGMDGYEVLRRLKLNEVSRHIPIVMLTGLGTEQETKIKGLQLGADAFLSKPCDPGELIAQIGVMLRIKEAEDKLRLENERLKNLNEQLGHEVYQRKLAEEQLRQHWVELENIVNERTSELHLLQDINNAVNMGKSMDDILKLTTEGVRDKLDYGVCDIYTYNSNLNELKLMAQSLENSAVKWIEKLTGLILEHMRISIVPGGHFDKVIRKRDVYYTDNIVEALEEYSQNKVLKALAPDVAKFLGFNSLMRAPLIAGDKVIGIIGVARKSPISVEDQVTLSRFASQVSGALWRAQTEEALKREYAFRQAIEDSVTSGITVVDLEGRMIYVNPAFSEMVGYSSEQLIGMTPPFLHWPKEEAGRIGAAMQNAISTRQLPSAFEAKYKRKDGKYVDVILNSSFLRDPDGEIIGILASVTNITDRKILEKQILVATEEERQKIGHELHDGVGQHLTGTAFMAKALEDKLRKRDIPESQEVSKIVGYLNETIDKVRYIAKGMSPVLSDSEHCCDLFEEIADYAESVLSIKCSYECDNNINIEDKGVLGQLYMIAREAIVNAAKHSKAKNVNITLKGTGNSLELCIEDNGSGFDMNKSAEPDDGLGLSIMRYRAGTIGALLDIDVGKDGGVRVYCTYKGRQ